MNYQKIELSNGEIVNLDLDAKRTRCKKCRELINFGLKDNGKYIPLIKINDRYQYHELKDCKSFGVTDSERNIRQQENNEEYLSSL